MRVLHLTLKKKWFDMIASGEKKEEYREIKPYYIRKFFKMQTWASPEDYYPQEICNELLKFPDEYKNIPNWTTVDFRKYDAIKFRNGYRKDSPTVTVKYDGLYVGQGKEEWGGGSDNLFVIKLGELLTNNKQE